MKLVYGSAGLRILVLLLAFATSVVTARGLGADGRGLVQLLMTLSVLASSLGGLSAELGFAHEFGKGLDERLGILSGAVYGSVAWGLLIGLVTVSVTSLLWTPPSEPTGALLFLAVYTMLTLTASWTQRALFLEGQPVRAAAVSVIEAALAFGVVSVTSLMGELTIGLTLLALAGASLAATAMSIAWSGVRPRQFRVRLLRRALAVGTRFHLGQCALQLLVRFDVVLLSAMAGLTSVGVYSVAVSLTAPVAVFATTIATTFLREQFTPDGGVARASTLRLVVTTTVLVTPGAALLVLAGVPLIPVVWGPEFAGARWPLVLLAPGVVALAVQRPVGNYFVRVGQARILNVRAVVAVAINVCLCLVLIPQWGAGGAAAASSVAYIAYAAISMQYWMRHAGVRWAEINWTFREVGAMVLGRSRGRTT